MVDERKPAAPAGLAARGRRFWTQTVGVYELSDSELNLLAEACRTLDQLEVLAAQVTADGTMIPGAAKQLVLHPAIGEARAQRVVLHRLLASLQLPDEDGASVPTTTTMRARRANVVRWAGH